MSEDSAKERDGSLWLRGYEGASNFGTDFTAASEAIASITRKNGLAWLRDHQQSNGAWLNNVGITSMAALTFLNAGYFEDDPTVDNAIDYIINKVHGDGSIYGDYNHRTYETSLATAALFATHNDVYNDTINNARNWLIGSQWDESCWWGSVNSSSWYYGGFGYGYSSRPDLSNTQFAILALDVDDPPDIPEVPSDVWTKAITFIQRCQNRPASNDLSWDDDPTQPSYNDGGFIYHPGASLAGGTRSYGSITGAGIWSMMLSKIPKNDPRVQDALDWVEQYEDCSFDVNPNMPYGGGRRLVYNYYWSISKALLMCGVEGLNGVPWYSALVRKLVSLQYSDGYWANTDMGAGNGWEHIPEIATSYALLSLQTKAPPPEHLWMCVILDFPGRDPYCADLHIYDPQGRHMGMNYDTGVIEEEIPSGTLESDASGKQTATLRMLQAGTYHIELVGIGDGNYTLTFQGYRDEEVTSTEIFEGDIIEEETQATDATVTAIVGELTIYVDQPRGVPGGVTATSGWHSIKLSWNKTRGAVGYKVYYDSDASGPPYSGTDANEGPSPIDVGDVTSFQLSGLTSEIPYYIAITAYDSLSIETSYSRQVIGYVGVVVPATVDIDPNTLNLKNVGKWITCYIELPEGYSVEDIDTSTVALTAIDAESIEPPLYREDPTGIGDEDEDGIPDLMVKFDRQDLIEILIERDKKGYVELTVGGELADGTVLASSLRGHDAFEPNKIVSVEPVDAIVLTNSQRRDDAFGSSGRGPAEGTVFVGVDTITVLRKATIPDGSQTGEDIPICFALYGNHPNPFRNRTRVDYALPTRTSVDIKIYDVSGKLVKILVSKRLDPGYYQVDWRGDDNLGRSVSAGVYFIRMVTKEYKSQHKVIFVR